MPDFWARGHYGITLKYERLFHSGGLAAYKAALPHAHHWRTVP